MNMAGRGLAERAQVLALLVAGAIAFDENALAQNPDAAYESALRAYVSTLNRLAAPEMSEAMRRVYAADKALALMRLADLAERRGAAAESTRLTSDALAACATAGLPYCTSAELRERMREIDTRSAAPELSIATPAAPAGARPLQLDASRLATAPVRYSSAATLQGFPIPVVYWRRAGLMAGEAEAEGIKSGVLYPLLLESRKPVAAFIVEFLPASDWQIGITVLWSDGQARETAIARSPQGKYAADAYKALMAKPTP